MMNYVYLDVLLSYVLFMFSYAVNGFYTYK